MAPYNQRMVTEIIATAVGAGGRGAQSRLARALGVQPQTINKWVHHEVCPEMAKWPAIEDALGLDQGTLRAASGIDDGTAPAATRIDQLEDRLTRVEALVEQLVDQLRDAARSAL